MTSNGLIQIKGNPHIGFNDGNPVSGRVEQHETKALLAFVPPAVAHGSKLRQSVLASSRLVTSRARRTSPQVCPFPDQA